MLSLPAGTRGEGPSRRASGGPRERSGGSVRWRPPPPPAYEGSPARAPAGLPAPARPAPAPRPEPQAGASVLPGRPLPGTRLSAGPRVAADRVASLASLSLRLILASGVPLATVFILISLWESLSLDGCAGPCASV